MHAPTSRGGHSGHARPSGENQGRYGRNLSWIWMLQVPPNCWRCDEATLHAGSHSGYGWCSCSRALVGSSPGTRTALEKEPGQLQVLSMLFMDALATPVRGKCMEAVL